MRNLFLFALLLTVSMTTGCATKISLGPIREDLKPTTQLSGKVHVMPVVDSARLVKYGNDYYSTVTGSPITAKSPYISETHPVSMLEKSITSCLTQSGLVVTGGASIPEDADLVFRSTATVVHITDTAPNTLFHLGVALATGLITSSSNPKSLLVMGNELEDRKRAAKSAVIFSGREEAFFYVFKGGGAERAFRLVQEDYCGWLQQKIAKFRADPIAADRVNKEEMAKLASGKK